MLTFIDELLYYKYCFFKTFKELLEMCIKFIEVESICDAPFVTNMRHKRHPNMTASELKIAQDHCILISDLYDYFFEGFVYSSCGSCVFVCLCVWLFLTRCLLLFSSLLFSLLSLFFFSLLSLLSLSLSSLSSLFSFSLSFLYFYTE